MVRIKQRREISPAGVGVVGLGVCVVGLSVVEVGVGLGVVGITIGGRLDLV